MGSSAHQQALAQKITWGDSNVFAVGNFRGGYAAQLAALENGFAGASYGGPGSVEFQNAPTPSNFKPYVNTGDPVGDYATTDGLD